MNKIIEIMMNIIGYIQNLDVTSPTFNWGGIIFFLFLAFIPIILGIELGIVEMLLRLQRKNQTYVLRETQKPDMEELRQRMEMLRAKYMKTDDIDEKEEKR